MSEGGTGGRTRVLFLPDYAHSNPYQRLLAESLREHGYDVTMARVPPGERLPILRAWVRHGCPPIVHLHWTQDHFGGPNRAPTRLTSARFLGQLICLRLLRVRLIWTAHNLGSHEHERGAREEASVHRRLVRLSHAVICHCSAALEAVAAAYGLGPDDRARLHVIPHGSYVGVYDDTVSRSEARRRLDLPGDARVFVFVGGVRRYKGLDELIRVFRDLDEPAARLVIAGRPRGKRTAATLEALAAGDARIRLSLGFVPPEELGVLLRASDAVVLPFRDVLTSGSAVLAMSFGRAVIAPSLGCLPETVGEDCALLYDAAAPDGLAQALRRAVTSADLEALGEAALARARALDWGSIAAATARLYRPA